MGTESQTCVEDVPVDDGDTVVAVLEADLAEQYDGGHHLPHRLLLVAGDLQQVQRPLKLLKLLRAVRRVQELVLRQETVVLW